MKTRLSIIFMVIATVLVSSLAAAADDKNWGGEAGVTGYYPSVLGNTAKFNEYGNLKNGMVSPDINVNAWYDDKKGVYLDFTGTHMGAETQYYGLDGGKWGSYKFNVFFNEIPHNVEWNARSFWYGAGSNVLGFATPPPTTVQNVPPYNWNYFDLSTTRKQFGGEFDLTKYKPFFFNVSYMDEYKKGIRASGVDLASSPGGAAAEFPMPIDYHTQGMKLEAGYGKNPFFVSLSYYYQTFANNNTNVYFQNPLYPALTNPLGRTPEVMTGAPDNSYQKFALDGNVKLPFNSVFNGKLGWAEAKSTADLQPYQIVGGVFTPIGLNQPDFNGKVQTTTASFALTSRPVTWAEGKAFYTYYNKDNKSDEVVFNQGGTLYTNPLFGYTKQTWGADIDWRLMKGFYLLTGYKHQKIHRDEREDVPNNNDDLYTVELRYKGLDWMSARGGYQYLRRAADHNGAPFGTPANADLQIENWVYRYDVAGQKKNTWKVEFTFSPTDVFNFGFGYNWAKTDYDPSLLGLQTSQAETFKFDTDYTLGKWAKLSGYFDYQWTKYNQFQRQFTNGSGLTNPGGVSNATNFNWTLDQTNKSYDMGAMADIFLIPKKLTLRLQGDYLRSNGFADFTYLTAAAYTGGRNTDNIDITGWDDYRSQRFLVKLFYNLTEKTSLTGGWAYERYQSSDAQYGGYQYVTAVPIYLTGVYSKPNYSANIYFLGVSHKF